MCIRDRVMLAAIRLAVTCPGAIPPKMSCVTFPMAPVGVMLASPVIRQTTSARKKAVSYTHLDVYKRQEYTKA